MSLLQQAEAVQVEAIAIVFPQGEPKEYTAPDSYRDLSPESKTQFNPSFIEALAKEKTERDELRDFTVKTILEAQGGYILSLCTRCKEEQLLPANPGMKLKFRHECGGLLLQSDGALAILYSNGDL
tara:strand:- start:19 stop:396 length:378 start_codon:yes stop_codon:yes gene_type:complete